MAKEADYRAMLIDLGIYRPAFDAEIHTLCVLERELSRTMKAWKATAEPNKAPSTEHPLYDVISRQRKDILTHRDALGLTPKALQRLLRQSHSQEAQSPAPSTGNAAFSSMMDQLREAANGSDP